MFLSSIDDLNTTFNRQETERRISAADINLVTTEGRSTFIGQGILSTSEIDRAVDTLRTTAPIWSIADADGDVIRSSRIAPYVGTDRQDITELMQDYIRNRNAENHLFINHNTCLREIEFNDINDIVEFRAKLDDIIKEHYQRR